MHVNPETCYSPVNESRAINTAHQNRRRKVRWINRAEEVNEDKIRGAITLRMKQRREWHCDSGGKHVRPEYYDHRRRLEELDKRSAALFRNRNRIPTDDVMTPLYFHSCGGNVVTQCLFRVLLKSLCHFFPSVSLAQGRALSMRKHNTCFWAQSTWEVKSKSFTPLRCSFHKPSVKNKQTRQQRMSLNS